jgi:hypothetical protein
LDFFNSSTVYFKITNCIKFSFIVQYPLVSILKEACISFMNCLKNDFSRARFLIVLFSIYTYLTSLLVKVDIINYNLISKIHYITIASIFIFPIILILTNPNKTNSTIKFYNYIVEFVSLPSNKKDFFIKISNISVLFISILLILNGMLY